ncbi:TPA: hypothetical protein PEQ97_001025 [Enterobacter hormaechei]|nr:hypothetical protein [Enterobacter hormaechei]MCC9330771.1 hypothetical protein [Enterobacter hormaechei subsp. steigerwaltii]MCC9334100.1 hypothetical protein [Enterobacter hormaechei subsp. steigerwaltii]MCC9343217.1 hypothetical protein [Enterobacter hormaechei subsp. steigerwaltii]MCC9348246.1 hypothetical protein [Enterobacter hormaechei subsp. steigerwaltii]MCC9355446.1 hypothetical protein [Enterobacter hormaechei subsp. steigerwaltii]
MSTITKEFTKEQLIQKLKHRISVASGFPDSEKAKMDLELARIALESLEAEPVAWLLSGGGAKNNVSFDSGNAYADPLREVTPLYTAPPAPVSVPAAMEMDDDFDSAFEHGKAVGWNAYRAAMLQGADRPQNEPQNIPENIPATQFKPVADLYGLTSPTGGETSFTFDAVEARDFIDGGWSCQEYVELGRFQVAMLQNGNYPAQSDCCPEQNYIAPAQDGNSPVIPDGWKLVPVDPTEEMNKAGWTAMNEHDAINPTYRAMLAAAPQHEDLK